MTTKTCDQCKHYTPPEPVEGLSPKVAAEYANMGDCSMTLDSNDGTPHADRAYGWDYESYHAGVHVGPKFGCNHWMKKDKK